MTSETQNLYGLLAKFESPEDLIAATERVYEAGFRRFDTYTPYPVEGLSQAMHLRPSLIPLMVLGGAIAGGVGAFLMQTYATVIDYPQNIGGRPLFSWPAYIPITFETTILVGALAGVLGLFFFARFPQPYHPVFRSDDFRAHASLDAFYLGIEASDPEFDLVGTRNMLHDLGSSHVSELEA
jgi:hypothetical protein